MFPACGSAASGEYWIVNSSTVSIQIQTKTKYYTTTYKPQYKEKEEEPYKPQEDKQENYVTKEPLYEKKEKGYYK